MRVPWRGAASASGHGLTRCLWDGMEFFLPNALSLVPWFACGFWGTFHDYLLERRQAPPSSVLEKVSGTTSDPRTHYRIHFGTSRSQRASPASSSLSAFDFQVPPKTEIKFLDASK